jgi:hypothetical protein
MSLQADDLGHAFGHHGPVATMALAGDPPSLAGPQ